MAASSTVLALASAATFLLLLLLHLSVAARPPLLAPAPVALPGCNATCGDVEVPYPFGYGSENCYWPGLNLTCDTTTNKSSPRLLLGDGTLRVTDIDIDGMIVRVVGKAGFIFGANGTSDSNITSGRWDKYSFGRSFTDYGYVLSSQANELSLVACSAMAALVGNTLLNKHTEMAMLTGGCSTMCNWDWAVGAFDFFRFNEDVSPSCVVPLRWDGWHSIELRISSLNSWEQKQQQQQQFPLYAVVAEKDWFSSHRVAEAIRNSSNHQVAPDEAPLILRWMVRYPGIDAESKLCKAQLSEGLGQVDGLHSNCLCLDGYGGNPYLDGGCQDIDECKLRLEDIGCISGECINTIGSFYCQCPPGSYGDPSVRDGCVKNSSSSISTTASQMIGLTGCNTSCGKVQVPYPFGFGHDARCYMPGFNLVCDTSHDPPRLLLGDGTLQLQVVDISLPDSTVRVIRNFNFSHVVSDDKLSGYMDLPSINEPYSLSSRNEFVLNGCGVEATLKLGILHGESRNIRLSSNCSSVAGDFALGTPIGNDYCSGTNGCSHAPILAGSTPMNVTFAISDTTALQQVEAYAFLAEGSLSMDRHLHMNLYREYNATIQAASLILEWAVKQGIGILTPPANNNSSGPTTCPGEVAHSLCRSDNSDCRQEHGGYTCHCWQGYDGNPYIPGGCKDLNECEIPSVRNACYGDCINLHGSHTCRCRRGTHGDPSLPNGCKPSNTGLSIGIGVGSGAGFILLVLIGIYAIKKLKHRRAIKLKQKFFKQNRGQLLQQLVAQRADIAERMIITLEELEKATNSFDRARELGGGGHGTVYKGILSDLHVVAIKKSKIAVQREIDEFINEVAILSQINHRNVVKLFGCCLETEVPLLVYEFVSNGTLDSHLHVEGPMSLSWNDRLRIATETAKAIAYLHSATSIPIIHRDIKSTNILLDDTLTSKVSDFGASRHIPIDRTGVTTNIQGTIGYLDPAYYYTGRLTEKSDVYSFGVLLVELLTRKKPYSSVSSDGLGLVAHFVTMHTSGSLVDILDQQVTQQGGNQQVTQVAELAVTCVKMTGDERPTMRQVEMTLEAIQAKVHTSNNAAAETFEEKIIRRMPSNPEGRSLQAMTRRHSLEEEVLLSTMYPR